jgi:deferrochelatase/peroxidase EfeB
MNARDAVIVGLPRLHRMIRRGTSYGAPLPEGELDDDGVERGLCFVFIGTQLARQFEFVQQQWVNDGKAFGIPDEKDPLVAANDGTGIFTVPHKPIRRRLRGLPRLVTPRGGEYFFAPSLSALRWIAALDS